MFTKTNGYARFEDNYSPAAAGDFLGQRDINWNHPEDAIFTAYPKGDLKEEITQAEKSIYDFYSFVNTSLEHLSEKLKDPDITVLKRRELRETQRNIRRGMHELSHLLEALDQAQFSRVEDQQSTRNHKLVMNVLE